MSADDWVELFDATLDHLETLPAAYAACRRLQAKSCIQCSKSSSYCSSCRADSQAAHKVALAHQLVDDLVANTPDVHDLQPEASSNVVMVFSVSWLCMIQVFTCA
jgi:hypothetical protein